ncbi:MAG: leucine-rich repeat domain-containing protein [Candidatus Omnitrophica bacterium]|nr:leucine-rich repeat domain-containing protein [Candidatus Omnitrophota bacterium]
MTTGSDVTEQDVLGGQSEVKGNTTYTQETIARWGQAKRGALFWDEANLADPGFGDFLGGMTEEDAGIWIHGKRHVLGDHVAVVTGNFESTEDRHPIEVIEEEGVTVLFEEFERAFLQKLLDGYLKNYRGNSTEARNLILDAHEMFRRMNPDNEFSIREIQEVANRIVHFTNGETTREDILFQAWLVYRGRFGPEDREALRFLVERKFGVSIPQMEAERRQQIFQDSPQAAKFMEAGISLVNETNELISDVTDVLALRRERMQGTLPALGKVSSIDIGPSGWGKDYILEKVLVANGLVDGFSREARSVDGARKYYLVNASMNYKRLALLIQRAKKEGSIVILREMNFLKTGILEGKLNDVLTGEAHPGFLFFGTLNQVGFSGRHRISSPLMSRSWTLFLDSHRPDSLREIARTHARSEGWEIDGRMIDNLVNFHGWVQDQIEDPQYRPTTREIFRAMHWLDAHPSGRWQDAVRFAYGPVFLNWQLSGRDSEAVLSQDPLDYQSRPYVDIAKVFERIAQYILPPSMGKVEIALNEKDQRTYYEAAKNRFVLSTQLIAGGKAVDTLVVMAGLGLFSRDWLSPEMEVRRENAEKFFEKFMELLSGTQDMFSLAGPEENKNDVITLYRDLERLWIGSSLRGHAFFPFLGAEKASFDEALMAQVVNKKDMALLSKLLVGSVSGHLGISGRQLFRYMLILFAKGLVTEENVRGFAEAIDQDGSLGWLFPVNPVGKALDHLKRVQAILREVPETAHEEEIKYRQWRAGQIMKEMAEDYLSIPESVSREGMNLPGAGEGGPSAKAALQALRDQWENRPDGAADTDILERMSLELEAANLISGEDVKSVQERSFRRAVERIEAELGKMENHLRPVVRPTLKRLEEMEQQLDNPKHSHSVRLWIDWLEKNFGDFESGERAELRTEGDGTDDSARSKKIRDLQTRVARIRELVRQRREQGEMFESLQDRMGGPQGLEGLIDLGAMGGLGGMPGFGFPGMPAPETVDALYEGLQSIHPDGMGQREFRPLEEHELVIVGKEQVRERAEVVRAVEKKKPVDKRWQKIRNQFRQLLEENAAYFYYLFAEAGTVIGGEGDIDVESLLRTRDIEQARRSLGGIVTREKRTIVLTGGGEMDDFQEEVFSFLFELGFELAVMVDPGEIITEITDLPVLRGALQAVRNREPPENRAALVNILKKKPHIKNPLIMTLAEVQEKLEGSYLYAAFRWGLDAAEEGKAKLEGVDVLPGEAKPPERELSLEEQKDAVKDLIRKWKNEESDRFDLIDADVAVMNRSDVEAGGFGIVLNHNVIGDQKIKELASLGLTRLVALDLSNSQVTDTESLARLEGLKHLILINTPVSDIRPLHVLPHLGYLDLQGTRVEDDQFEDAVAGVGKRGITIVTRYGDTQLFQRILPPGELSIEEQIEAAKNLIRKLDKDLTFVTIDADKRVQYSSRLNGITIDLGSFANDQVIKELAALGLTKVVGLDLNRSSVRDISPLVALIGLKALYLGETKVSDIRPLSALPHLEHLNIVGTDVGSDQFVTAVGMDEQRVTIIDRWGNVNPGRRILAPGELSLEEQIEAAKNLVRKWQEKNDWLRGYEDLGLIVYDRPEKGGIYIDLRNAANDEMVRELSELGLTKVVELNLSETPVSDVTPLTKMTGLRVLWLDDTRVSDIRPLSSLPDLKFLDIVMSGEADRFKGQYEPTGDETGIEIFVREDLRLYHQRILSPGEMTAQEQYEKIVSIVDDWINRGLVDDPPDRRTPILILGEGEISLNLIRSRLNDQELEKLRGMDKINCLDLYWSGQVADIGVLSTLTGLRSLNLSGTGVTDVKPLAALKKLTELYLDDTKVRDIRVLHQLRGLKRLWITDTEISYDQTFRPSSGLQDLEVWIGINDYTPLQHQEIVPPEGEEAGEQAAELSLEEQIAEMKELLQEWNGAGRLGKRARDIDSLIGKTGNPETFSLDLQDTRVRDEDLARLSKFSRIAVLNISETRITRLGPVSALKWLVRLEAWGTAVSDLRPLSQLKHLAKLKLQDTQVSDLRPLADMGSLVELVLTRTPVTDISSLASLNHSLRKLNLFGTAVGDGQFRNVRSGWGIMITASDGKVFPNKEIIPSEEAEAEKPAELSFDEQIERAKELIAKWRRGGLLTAGEGFILRYVDYDKQTFELNLANSKIGDQELKELSVLRNIGRLNLNSTGVIDLSPLSRLTNLRSLDLAYTQVSNLESLSGLTELAILELSHTPIVNLRPLSEVPSLWSLQLNHTQVSDLSPLSGLTALRMLWIEHTQVPETQFRQSTGHQKIAIVATGHVDAILDQEIVPAGEGEAEKEKEVDQRKVAREKLALRNMLDDWVEQGAMYGTPEKVIKDEADGVHYRMNLFNRVVSDDMLKQLAGLGLNYVTELNLGSNGITDVAPLASMKSLKRLDLSVNPISNVDALAGLKLQELNLGHTQVTNLNALIPLNSTLEWLNVGGTKVPDWQFEADESPLRSELRSSGRRIATVVRADGRPINQVRIVAIEEKPDEVKALIEQANVMNLVSQVLGGDAANYVSLDKDGIHYNVNLSGTGIGDEELKELGNLQPQYLIKLDLANTRVTDISPIAGMSGLKKLSLANTAVRDLNPVRDQLNTLEFLNLHATQVPSDIFAITGMGMGIDLCIYPNGSYGNDRLIMSYEVEKGKPSGEMSYADQKARVMELLEDWKQKGRLSIYSDIREVLRFKDDEETLHLDFYNQNIGNGELAQLAGLTRIVSLGLTNVSGLHRIPEISGLTGLRILHLNRSSVDDLTPLGDLPNLETLDLGMGWGQVRDLAPLARSQSLVELNIEDSQVKNFSDLAHLKTLKKVSIEKSNITMSDFQEATDEQNLTVVLTSGFVRENKSIKPAQEEEPQEDLTGEECIEEYRKVIDGWIQAGELVLEAGKTSQSVVDNHPGNKDVSGIFLSGSNVTNEQVRQLARMRGASKIHIIDLSKTPFSDTTALEGFKGLEILDLSSTLVRAVQSLSRFEYLVNVDLQNSGVENIDELARCPRLKRLDISGTQVDDIRPLALVISLEFLRFVGAPVPDSQWQEADHETKLTVKTVSGSTVHNAEIVSDVKPDTVRREYEEQLARVTALLVEWGIPVDERHIDRRQDAQKMFVLNLSRQGITNERLARLSGLTRMSELWVGLNPITSLENLRNLPNLDIIDLTGTQVRDVEPLTGFESLQAIVLAHVKNPGKLGSLRKLRLLNRLVLEGTDIDVTEYFDELLPGTEPGTGLWVTDNERNKRNMRWKDQEETEQSEALSLEQQRDLLLELLRKWQAEGILMTTRGMSEFQVSILPAKNRIGLNLAGEGKVGDEQLRELGRLARKLTCLTWIDLGLTQVSDLNPLADFHQLEDLDIRSTKVVDLSPLAELSSLQVLMIDKTEVRSVQPLWRLPNLIHIEAKDLLRIAPDEFGGQFRGSETRKLTVKWGKGDDEVWTDLEIIPPGGTEEKPQEGLSFEEQITRAEELIAKWKAAGLLRAKDEADILEKVDYRDHTFELNLAFTDIGDEELRALSVLKNMVDLGLQFTKVRDVSPLSELTNLKKLYLNTTQVSNLSPLSELTNLEFLNLNDTHVSDLSPLAGLTNLTELYLAYTQVSDLSPLSGLTKLGLLRLLDTRVSDSQFRDSTGRQHISITTASGEKKLEQEIVPAKGAEEKQQEGLSFDEQIARAKELIAKWKAAGFLGDKEEDVLLVNIDQDDHTFTLHLGGTAISNKELEEISESGLTAMTKLILSSTQVTDLGSLSGLRNLEGLSFQHTQVNDLRPLSGLTNLRLLVFTNTQVSDLKPLSGLKNLRDLYLGDKRVSDLKPLSGLTNLEILHLTGTDVKDLGPLSRLTHLRILALTATQVSDLTPLSELTNLEYLYLTHTQVLDTQFRDSTGRQHISIVTASGEGRENQEIVPSGNVDAAAVIAVQGTEAVEDKVVGDLGIMNVIVKGLINPVLAVDFVHQRLRQVGDEGLIRVFDRIMKGSRGKGQGAGDEGRETGGRSELRTTDSVVRSELRITDDFGGKRPQPDRMAEQMIVQKFGVMVIGLLGILAQSIFREKETVAVRDRLSQLVVRRSKVHFDGRVKAQWQKLKQQFRQQIEQGVEEIGALRSYMQEHNPTIGKILELRSQATALATLREFTAKGVQIIEMAKTKLEKIKSLVEQSSQTLAQMEALLDQGSGERSELRIADQTAFHNALFELLKTNPIHELSDVMNQMQGQFDVTSEQVVREIVQIGVNKEIKLPGGGWDSYLPEFDPDTGKFTGRIIAFHELHKRGQWHGVIYVLLLTPEGDVIAQVRSDRGWTDIPGGHQELGDEPVETGVDEVGDEMAFDASGISIMRERLMPVVNRIQGTPFFKKVERQSYGDQAYYDEDGVFHVGSPYWELNRELDYLFVVFLDEKESAAIQDHFKEHQTEEVSGLVVRHLDDIAADLRKGKIGKYLTGFKLLFGDHKYGRDVLAQIAEMQKKTGDRSELHSIPSESSTARDVNRLDSRSELRISREPNAGDSNTAQAFEELKTWFNDLAGIIRDIFAAKDDLDKTYRSIQERRESVNLSQEARDQWQALFEEVQGLIKHYHEQVAKLKDSWIQNSEAILVAINTAGDADEEAQLAMGAQLLAFRMQFGNLVVDIGTSIRQIVQRFRQMDALLEEGIGDKGQGAGGRGELRLQATGFKPQDISLEPEAGSLKLEAEKDFSPASSSQVSLKSVALALFPLLGKLSKRVLGVLINPDVVDSLITQYRENAAELEQRLLAQVNLSERDAVLKVLNDLDASMGQVNQSFAIGAVIPEEFDEELMPAFFEGFVSGLDASQVGEMLQDGGRLPQHVVGQLKGVGVQTRAVDVHRPLVLRGDEQDFVPMAMLTGDDAGILHDTFQPLFVDRIEELRQDPDTLRWLGKLTSRALIHMADLSEDIKLKTDPDMLKAELLRRLNLEGYDELITLSQKGGRLAFGINAVTAQLVFTQLVEESIATSA